MLASAQPPMAAMNSDISPPPLPADTDNSAAASPEQRSILTICLLAAFADGDKSDAERARFTRIADSLASPGFDTAGLYQDVLLKRVTLPQAAAALSTPEFRRLAYEMAVGVCDADDALNPAEQRFLAELRRALGLDASATARFDQYAGQIQERARNLNPSQLLSLVRGK